MGAQGSKIVHELGSGVVATLSINFFVLLRVEALLHYQPVTVVKAVCHGDHGGVGEPTPPEAARAYLGIGAHEVLAGGCLLSED